jgi:CheY-like chemotaxis protein
MASYLLLMANYHECTIVTGNAAPEEREFTAMNNSPRVLIVEDEHLVARDLERRLRRLGYTIVAFVTTGTEAVHHALEHRPDLVLTDIRLRGEMDGIEAIQSIRKRLNVRVIYLSAYIDEATLARAQATHPDAFLDKPFNASSLQATLQRVLPQ